jgi:hypothetical protein
LLTRQEPVYGSALTLAFIVPHTPATRFKSSLLTPMGFSTEMPVLHN